MINSSLALWLLGLSRASAGCSNSWHIIWYRYIMISGRLYDLIWHWTVDFSFYAGSIWIQGSSRSHSGCSSFRLFWTCKTLEMKLDSIGWIFFFWMNNFWYSCILSWIVLYSCAVWRACFSWCVFCMSHCYVKAMVAEITNDGKVC